MSIEVKVEQAVRRTNLLWNAWSEANDQDKVEIKAQIDAIDAEITALLGA